jgi:hypothetical protein
MLTLLLKVANKYVVSVIDDYVGERSSVALYSFGFEFFFVLVLVQVQSISLTTRYGFTKQSVSACDRRLIFSIICCRFLHRIFQISDNRRNSSRPYVTEG